MAKKKQNSQREELELDQAYFDLTGYDSGSKKKKSIGGVLIGAVCMLALVLAGCIIGIPFLLSDNPPTLPTSTTAPADTEGPQDRFPADTVILGVDLSGMTNTEAATALASVMDADMKLVINGETYPVSTTDCVSSFDAAGAADALLNNPQEFDLTHWLVLDKEAIRDIARSYAVMHQQEAVPTTYTVMGEMPTLEPVDQEPECQMLVVVKGKPSASVDSEALYQAILQGFEQGNLQAEIPVISQPPEDFDLQAVLDSCYIAPVDAVMDMYTFEVSGGTYGYEFDTEQAQALLDSAEYGDVLQIPFYRTAPNISAESLASMLFRDVLAYSATPHTNEFNRNTNLKLACQAINGVVVYPGEIFSYNATLGERTTEKGYLPAASYIGEETVDTVGGGICQVSSTLYHCTLLADLWVTERACHGFAVSYLPLGMDATVSWGGYDFCFKNDSRYPLRIEAWVADGSVHVRLIGTEERQYYMEIVNYVEETLPYDTEYREFPPDNPEGYEDGDVIVTPYIGYKVHTYRCRYSNETDTLISEDYEDYSEYWSRNEVIVKIVEPEN